jgi:hypothetical protein
VAARKAVGLPSRMIVQYVWRGGIWRSSVLSVLSVARGAGVVCGRGRVRSSVATSYLTKTANERQRVSLASGAGRRARERASRGVRGAKPLGKG